MWLLVCCVRESALAITEVYSISCKHMSYNIVCNHFLVSNNSCFPNHILSAILWYSRSGADTGNSDEPMLIDYCHVWYSVCLLLHSFKESCMVIIIYRQQLSERERTANLKISYKKGKVNWERLKNNYKWLVHHHSFFYSNVLIK